MKLCHTTSDKGASPS